MHALTVTDLFDAAVVDHVDRDALVFEDVRLSFGELDAEVGRAAAVLAAAGVRRGTAVGASVDNCIQVVVAFLASMRLGARWVGINRALGARERSFVAAHAGVRVLVADAAVVDELAGHPTVRSCFATGPGGGSWDAAVAAAVERRSRRPLDPFAPAAVSYTSGTTGRPKGVVHSQHNLALPPIYLSTTTDFDRSSRPATCLPLTILNVIVVSVLPGLLSGAGCVLLARPEARAIASAVRRERITTLTIPAPTLHDLAVDDHIDTSDLATLDRPRTGGAGLSEHVRSLFRARFGVEPVATYGLTEAPTVVTQEERGAPHRPGASGRPLPYLDVRIVGEDGRRLRAGETGEICVGPHRTGPWAGVYRPMLGYHRRPAATRSARRDGYLCTGDTGWLDGDGNLYVTDRKSSVILRGGASVYPAEVERVLVEVPGVADVAVVGIPDVRLGERVGAAVELRPGADVTEEEVLAHGRSVLARYKAPEVVRFVPSLPRNAMRKVDRRAVVRLLADDPTIPRGAHVEAR